MTHRPLVLLTGSTGHIGFRILVFLLQAKYKVRCTIRKSEQEQRILATASLQPFLDHVSFALVPDMTAPGAYDTAIVDVEHVVHVASPIPHAQKDGSNSWKEIYYDPAIDGTLRILEAASREESKVTRVVITSSAAVLASYTSHEAGPLDLKSAPSMAEAEAVPSGVEAYEVSKVLSIQAARSYVSKRGTSYDTIFICPGYVQGVNELHSSAEDMMASSNEGTLNALLGNVAPYAKPGVLVWLDDVAKAHVVSISEAYDVTDRNGDVLLLVGNGGKASEYDDIGRLGATMFPSEVEAGVLKPVVGQKTGTVDFAGGVKLSEKRLGFEFGGPERWVREIGEQYLRLKGCL